MKVTPHTESNGSSERKIEVSRQADGHTSKEKQQQVVATRDINIDPVSVDRGLGRLEGGLVCAC